MPPRTRQPRVWIAVLRAVVGLAALVILAGCLLKNRDLLVRALRIDWPMLLAISAGVWGLILVRAFQIQVLLRALGTAAGLTSLMGLNAAINALNYLPVRAGFVMGAIWLRRRRDLRYARFFSLAVATVGLGLVTAGGFGLIGVALSAEASASSGSVLLTVFGLGLVVPLAVCLAPRRPRRPTSSRRRRGLRRFALGLRRIGRDRSVLAQSLLAQGVQYLLRCARLYLVFHVCGVEIDLFGALVVQSLVNFSTFAVPTPGSLGTREGAIAVAAEWLGAGFDAGLVAAALDRAVLLLWTLVLGLPSAVWLTHQIAGADRQPDRRDALPDTM